MLSAPPDSEKPLDSEYVGKSSRADSTEVHEARRPDPVKVPPPTTEIIRWGNLPESSASSNRRDGSTMVPF